MLSQKASGKMYRRTVTLRSERLHWVGAKTSSFDESPYKNLWIAGDDFAVLSACGPAITGPSCITRTLPCVLWRRNGVGADRQSQQFTR